MAVIKEVVNFSLYNKTVSTTIIDQCRCEKLLSSFERYSNKLDKLLETASNIEQESKRNFKCR